MSSNWSVEETGAHACLFPNPGSLLTTWAAAVREVLAFGARALGLGFLTDFALGQSRSHRLGHPQDPLPREGEPRVTSDDRRGLHKHPGNVSIRF